MKDLEHLLQLEIIGLTEEDLQVARTLKPHIEARAKEIVEAFYKQIGRVQEFRQMINQYEFKRASPPNIKKPHS